MYLHWKALQKFTQFFLATDVPRFWMFVYAFSAVCKCFVSTSHNHNLYRLGATYRWYVCSKLSIPEWLITGTPTWRGTTQQLDGTIMESVVGSSISGTSNIIPAYTGGTCTADMIEQWAYILSNKLWYTSLKRWTFAQTVHGIFAKNEAVEDITHLRKSSMKLCNFS